MFLVQARCSNLELQQTYFEKEKVRSVFLQYEEFKEKYQICLNYQQEIAIQKVGGAVLLLAVPGSGKTTVLVNRLGYMVFCRGIAPESILTVTYTVAATNDMKRRFIEKFGAQYGRRLEFRTINGISQKILQYFGAITGKSPFEVADKESVDILKHAFFNVNKQFPTENDIKNAQTAITYIKNMRLKEDQIEQLSVDVRDFPKLYRTYNRTLRERKLIDYDDQMVYALQILEQFPQVLQHFREKYSYICVDEAQDTSKIQHDMISLLVGKQGNLFMVGDEDQSIYGFRAAYPAALVSFEQTYPNAKVLFMESNYRSREEIVKAADKLIQENTARHPKHMHSTRPAGGKVFQIRAKTRKGQYEYLLKIAKDCQKETAILYRNNESALPLIDCMERQGLTYRMKSRDMAFFSHPIVNDIRDYISLALDPFDGEAFFRIYYKLGAGISKAVATQLVEQNRRKVPLIDAIDDCMGISSFTKRRCRALSVHFDKMRMETAGKALFRILHYMGYEEYMLDHGMDSGKAEILQLLAEQQLSLEEFPKRLDRLQEIVSEEQTNTSGSIILSTIHSSKGLEYERVYMIDMLVGILPSCKEPRGEKKTQEEVDAYEEERRLYYVGMTRAKEELYIFSFQQADTSKFTTEIFGTTEKKIVPAKQREAKFFSKEVYGVSQLQSMVKQIGIEEKMKIYEDGVIVEHKKYGKGVVVKRQDCIVEILFDKQEKTKRIQLPFALSKGLLAIVR